MVVDLDFRNGQALCVLRLRGRFHTGADVEYLRGKIDELKLTPCRKAVADLSEVPYLDSTGIGFLVGMYTSMRNANGRFVLANLQPRVREVLSITRLVDILEIYPGEAAAIAALETPGQAAGA